MADVDIILPVLNGADTIVTAVRSLQLQTLVDIRILVIDDGSTDRTPDLLRNMARDDRRIEVHRTEVHGISHAANLGLELSTAPFVARMDADDISLPDRLAAQMAHLAAHSEVIACGSQALAFGTRSFAMQVPVSAEDCRLALSIFNPMIHATAMMRSEAKALARPWYDEAFAAAEDYDFFQRLSSIGELSNLPDVHLLYRIHPTQMSQRKRQLQRELAYKVAVRHIAGQRSITKAHAVGQMAANALKLGGKHFRPSARGIKNAILL